MSYNLLLDTKFAGNNWKFINCTYQDGILTSSSKVFGIEQELILPDPTKLYFRINYITDNISIKEVKIGIQNGDTLNINRKTPKLRKRQKISVIDIAKQERIKLHVIFESEMDVNRVQIEQPILCDLMKLGKSTWLKAVLDKVLYFKNGYSYENIYKESELKFDIDDFKGFDFESAKIGSIIKLDKNISIPINAKFINDRYYLVKLDYKEINRFGNTYFKYGVLQSTKTDDEQCYLILKGNQAHQLMLCLESNDVLDYQVNLKHLLIIDITKMKILKGDVPYLPFV